MKLIEVNANLLKFESYDFEYAKQILNKAMGSLNRDFEYKQKKFKFSVEIP